MTLPVKRFRILHNASNPSSPKFSSVKHGRRINYKPLILLINQYGMAHPFAAPTLRRVWTPMQLVAASLFTFVMTAPQPVKR